MTKPVTTMDDQLRRGLRTLIAHGRMFRTTTDYQNKAGDVRLPLDLGRRMKERGFAIAGFEKDMVATDRGKTAVREFGK
jgi:hypothetical protein